ncbi:MAG: superoxide dismutase copper/zinc binding [Propionibacteriaceae bacterium]|nr:superoxide dismutase copper/zinc binding [Propionibacteriaceae bacterium]
MKLIRKVIALGAATVTTAVTSVLVFGYPATAHDAEFRAKLRDPSGRVVGTVKFRIGHDSMRVDAVLRPNRYVAPGAFHGFHVHANNDPANGQGCVADPSASASTWFVSADGHLSAQGQTHGAHNGDMPSPLVMADGTARLRFATDRIDPNDLRGRAVILHAKPDNFGNVPMGIKPDQYTANSAAATDLTARTGNASDRVACGLVRRSR